MSINNGKRIRESSVCGCFYCCEIFTPDKITEYVPGEDTPFCPFCGIDSVIGDKEGYKITKELLSKISKDRFGPCRPPSRISRLWNILFSRK